jgi:hypothetical protein
VVVAEEEEEPSYRSIRKLLMLTPLLMVVQGKDFLLVHWWSPMIRDVKLRILSFELLKI